MNLNNFITVCISVMSVSAISFYISENTEINKNRKPNGRRAAMDMEKVQAVF